MSPALEGFGATAMSIETLLEAAKFVEWSDQIGQSARGQNGNFTGRMSNCFNQCWSHLSDCNPEALKTLKEIILDGKISTGPCENKV